MRILAIGDVVGSDTVAYLHKHLWEVRRRERIDFTVANGENTSAIRGLSAKDASALLDTGIDLITLGNHAFGCRDLYAFLDANGETIIRPANYPASAPGQGYTLVRVDGWRVLCMAVSGRVFLDPLADPFDTVDRILERERGAYDFALLDIHGEATSEKLAIAHYFDGRVAVMFGTHTHVPTADEQVLPHGSGYITDLGMTGPTGGIIGTATEDVIHRFRTQLPTKFNVASGEIRANGAIFDVDESAGRVRSVKRIVF
ncbi:MAG: YmdB family metallophosphoesterase [Clostridia bacterium]|nr:YmdB family metallophosphoesterase [Clostridia bacterium]